MWSTQCRTHFKTISAFAKGDVPILRPKRNFFTRRIYRQPHHADQRTPRQKRRDKVRGDGEQSSVKVRPDFVRLFDPWHDLANVLSQDNILSDKVDSVTRTFGVVAALMSSLSAALIAAGGYSSWGEKMGSDKRNTAKPGETVGVAEHIAATQKVSGTSLLVSWGVPREELHGIYTACCAGSFYSSVTAMGLSAVINAWLAATPPGGVRHFVRSHSLFIVTVPGLLGLSTGLAGVALFIGLDRAKGTPISYIGLGGTTVGGILIGSAWLRGWNCTYRLLTNLLKKV